MPKTRMSKNRILVSRLLESRILESRMIRPYRALFSVSGTGSFALAGLLARIALPMTGIGIIVMLSQLRGSYAMAGAVSATFVLTYALLSPQISRLVDAYGQSRILPIATAISTSGLCTLVLCAWWHTPDWTLFIGAFLAGCMPSISAMVRARWTVIYRGQPQLQTAYSLETVFDEVTFIIGPPLAVGLSVAVLPQASLVIAALLLISGVVGLVLQRSTEPQVKTDLSKSVQFASDATQLKSNQTKSNQTKATQYEVSESKAVESKVTESKVTRPAASASVISSTPIRLLTLLMIAMGIIVGTVDIVSVAFAKQLRQPAAASVVLSAYAVGSCLSGLAFGSLKLQLPLHRLLLLGGVATALSTLPLFWVNNIVQLATAVFIAGLFFAPTMIVAMSLVEQVVPEHRLTEGMTWLLAGLNIGVAIGAALSGQVVDTQAANHLIVDRLIMDSQMLQQQGVQIGFVVAIAGAVMVLLMAMWGRHGLAKYESCQNDLSSNDLSENSSYENNASESSSSQNSSSKSNLAQHDLTQDDSAKYDLAKHDLTQLNSAQKSTSTSDVKG